MSREYSLILRKLFLSQRGQFLGLGSGSGLEVLIHEHPDCG